MIPEKDIVVHLFNDLIAACADCEKEYRNAAEIVSDTRLQLLFRRYEQLHAEFAAELQAEERAYTPSPPAAGTLGGALHRRWMSLRHAVVRSGDDDTILADCLRVQERTRGAYERAFQAAFPSRLTVVLRRHLNAVTDACRELSALPTTERTIGRTP